MYELCTCWNLQPLKGACSCWIHHMYIHVHIVHASGSIMARRAAAPYSAYSAPKPWKSASGVPSYRGPQADPPSSPPPASFCGLCLCPRSVGSNTIRYYCTGVSRVEASTRSTSNYRAQYKYPLDVLFDVLYTRPAAYSYCLLVITSSY